LSPGGPPLRPPEGHPERPGPPRQGPPILLWEAGSSRCPAPLSWEQGLPHDDRVPVGPIILEHSAGEDCKLGKPELPPQASGHLVFCKDQVEDHAPIPKFLR